MRALGVNVRWALVVTVLACEPARPALSPPAPAARPEVPKEDPGAPLVGEASALAKKEIAIATVVRASFEPLKRCYEAGLARDPNLTGRVTTMFVISSTGEVTSLERVPGGADEMPDAAVSHCVREHFATFTFPPMPNQSVIYPIVFNPGD